LPKKLASKAEHYGMPTLLRECHGIISQAGMHMVQIARYICHAWETWS